MRLVAYSLVGLMACGGTGDDSYPVEPGGGGDGQGNSGSGSATSDGGVDGGVGPDKLSGRVCVLTDPRDFSSCAPAGVAGIKVSLANATAVSAADGSFSITKPVATDAVWKLTSSTIEIYPSLVPFSTNYTVPVLTRQLYEDLAQVNQVTLVDGTAAIFVRVTDGTDGIALAEVTGDTLAMPRYDSISGGAAVWGLDATGEYGVAWLSGIEAPPSPTGVAVRPDGEVTPVIKAVPVEADAITFITVIP